MKNPKTILIVFAALALILVGFLFVRGPQPIIEIKAEKLADIGPFPFVNTYLTSLLVVVVIAAAAWFLTRKVELIPGKKQNVIEAVVEAMYTITVNTAGQQNARRFFPVVMTIFTFIWIANWMALLPFFNAIGSVEKVDGEHFHHSAVVLEDRAGIGLIMPNETALEFHEEEVESWNDVTVLESRLEEARAEGAAESEITELEHLLEEAEVVARQDAILHTLHEEEIVPEDVHSLDEAYAMLDEEGKTVGVIFPYFRSMNTDINSPLSIAIWAMIFVEFWGITALGFFKYAGKFLNFSSPIYFFVGILEFIAEIARLISFTFRLFGNMLAGEILLLVMTFLLPFLVAVPFYGLEVFVGLIQAFVFAMLTLVFAVLAVTAHEDHDEHEIESHTPDLPLEGPVPATH